MPEHKLPKRLSVNERISCFSEVEKALTLQQAINEATRCLRCDDPPCVKGCPAKVDVLSFIEKIRTNNLVGSIRVIKENNIFAGVCARICPQEELCEKSCSAIGLAEPIAIGALQRFAADEELKSGAITLDLPKYNGKKVAIIGAGPAGLSCAVELRLKGYEPIIFEKSSQLGGTIRCIPPYRLPKDILDKEIEFILNLGINVKTNSEITNVLELLSQGFSSVVIATGLGEPNKISATLINGMIEALDFLSNYNEFNFKDKTVVVLGGGSTAMDAGRTAVRLGAKKVTIAYRRTENEMPAWEEERKSAREEGIDIMFLVSPLEFIPNEKGVLSKIKFQRNQLGEPDESGRRRPVPIPNSEFTMDADISISALGQNSVPSFVKSIPNLKLNSKGSIEVDTETYQTSIPKIFACGDVVNGGTTVVQAVEEGKKVARGIAKLIG